MEVIDIETAFLYGDLDVEIYMKIPSGMKEVFGVDSNNICLQLDKSIYGLVQAARQWFTTFMNVMKMLDFKRARIDPCLLSRIDEQGTVLLVVYVDDVCLIGDKDAIDAAINDIEREFTIKRVGTLKEYIGVTVECKTDEIHLTQLDIIEKMEHEFRDLLKDAKEYESPMGSNVSILRPKEQDKLITDEMQKRYRSGVGSLLYLVKQTRPDLSNSVRELAKVLDGATEAHLKFLVRAIKYTLDTENMHCE